MCDSESTVTLPRLTLILIFVILPMIAVSTSLSGVILNSHVGFVAAQAYNETSSMIPEQSTIGILIQQQTTTTTETLTSTLQPTTSSQQASTITQTQTASVTVTSTAQTSSGLDTGSLIIGIVIGAVIGAATAAIIFSVKLRRRQGLSITSVRSTGPQPQFCVRCGRKAENGICSGCMKPTTACTCPSVGKWSRNNATVASNA